MVPLVPPYLYQLGGSNRLRLTKGAQVECELVASLEDQVSVYPHLRLLTTDTKVALDLSPQSLAGESPVARLGFFLVVITPVRSLVVLSSLFFMSTLFSSSAFA